MAFFNKKTGNDHINIDTEKVKTVAAQIRRSNKSMIEDARSIVTIVDKLEDDWDSDVRKDFRTRVGKTGQVYEQYFALLENVADLLEQAAHIYEKTENANLKYFGEDRSGGFR